jgi:hypothetical protein
MGYDGQGRSFAMGVLLSLTTLQLLDSVLKSEAAREAFKLVASSQIAETSSVKQAVPGADLEALKGANLIGSGGGGNKLYVTAKGLQVARDLEKLPVT